jgi:DNA modification methylase
VTTFAVCKKLNRNFIGFEMNPDFVAITKERVRQIELQKEYSLFK